MTAYKNFRTEVKKNRLQIDRRGFLKLLGAGALGGICAPLLGAASPSRLCRPLISGALWWLAKPTLDWGESGWRDELDQQRNLVVGAKKLAVEYSMPVILISQLRKTLQGEDRTRPTLERLYGTSGKAKHGSIVVYADRKFVRELEGDETQARISVLKNRNGRIGSFDARFNVHTLRFEEAPSSPAPRAEKPKHTTPEERLPYRDNNEVSA